MNTVLPVSLRKPNLRKAVPVFCLVALTAVLTGCGPESSERLFPNFHNSGLGAGGQLVTQSAMDFRHHARTTRVSAPHRHNTHLEAAQ